MFPVIVDAAPRTLSPSQAKLLQASLLYRAGTPMERRHVPVPTYRDWRAGLSGRAVATVGSICGAGAPSTLDGADVQQLMTLATDTGVSPAIRRAALEAVGPQADADAVHRARAIVRDDTLPRDVRLGAIAILERAAPRWIRRLPPDADPAVEQYVARHR